MKLLAIETATEACSVALQVDGQLFTRFEVRPREHTRLILPMIEELLQEAGIERSDLQAIAFGRGPGSFTGVRIAAGIAQGIAFALDLPVVPVSTLAALAQQAMERHGAMRVLAAIDARMGEVYWGAYLRDESGLASLESEEVVCPPDAVPLPTDLGWYGIGSGWYAHAEILKMRVGAAVTHSDDVALPRAEQVAVLGQAAFRAGQTVPAEKALPVYLRDRVAAKAAPAVSQ